MSSPRLQYRLLEASRGETASTTSEDASSVVDDAWPVGAAVADGATESAFSGRWARILVRVLARRRATDPSAFRRGIEDGRREWRRAVARRATDGPWYVRAKAEEGAFAAVLSLSVHADGTWRALSVGDCCFLRLHGGHVRRSWPFADPDEFTNRPSLVASRSSHPVPTARTTSGTWTDEDTLLLATDAAAAWILGTQETPVERWKSETFRSIVRTARNAGALRNDDVTLLVLNVASSPEADG